MVALSTPSVSLYFPNYLSQEHSPENFLQGEALSQTQRGPVTEQPGFSESLAECYPAPLSADLHSRSSFYHSSPVPLVFLTWVPHSHNEGPPFLLETFASVLLGGEETLLGISWMAPNGERASGRCRGCESNQAPADIPESSTSTHIKNAHGLGTQTQLFLFEE